MTITGITPANRTCENCTIGALSYYCAKTGHLELLVYRNSSTGYGLQSYRPSKKIYLMRAATSYHLWFCPSPREWLLTLLRRVKAKVIGDLFSFFPWCLQAASKTNLFFKYMYLIIEFRIYSKKNSNFYIKIQTYFSSVTCMIDVFLLKCLSCQMRF